MELQEAAAALGMYWPDAAPQRLRAGSAGYRQAASDISAILAGCHSPAGLVLAHNQGPPIEAFAAHWERWQHGAGSLGTTVAACDQLADALDAYARVVEKARHRIGKLVRAAATLLGCARSHGHTGRTGHLGHRAEAVLAGLVAASWAEREALLAAAEGAGAMAVLRACGGRQGGGAGPLPGATGAAAAFRRQPRIAPARSTPTMAAGPAAPGLAPGAALPGLPARPRAPSLPPHVGGPPLPSHGSASGSPFGDLGVAVHRVAGFLGSAELLAGGVAAGAATAGWSAVAAIRASRHPRGEGAVTDWVEKVSLTDMMWEAMFDRALSEREVVDAVTSLLPVAAPEAVVVSDVTEVQPGPEVRVLCESRSQRGQFPFRLTLYVRDDSLLGYHERLFFQGLSAMLGCACLIADRGLSPHSMLLLQGPGRASRVCLDPDRLEQGEYVVLRPGGASELR